IEQRRALAHSARGDFYILNQYYTNVDIHKLSERLDRASGRLRQTADLLNSAVDGLAQSERLRYHHFMLNALDQLDLARSSLNEASKKKDLLALTPFSGLLGPQDLKDEIG